MPQSLFFRVWLHLVFSTNQRRPYLRRIEFREEMFRMLSFHVTETGSVSASVGGHVDHVHLLVGLSRTVSISKLIEIIKSETSKWAKKSEYGPGLFSWQRGYGVFSVSHSQRDLVDQYIRNQSDHHEKLTFKNEFRLLCEKHGIEIDERYVWD